VLDKEFKSLILKLINDLKEDINKQMNEVKKSIQDLNEEIQQRDRCWKLKKTQTEKFRK
jgi:gas vesicle protein